MIRTLLLLFLLCSVAEAQVDRLRMLFPRPKTAYGTTVAGGYSLRYLVVPENPSPVTERAISYLQRGCREQLGDTLLRVTAASYPGQEGIFIGEPSSFPELAIRLAAAMPRGETMPPAEGYVLDVTAREILLGGTDPEGTFNGVSTLVQFLGSTAYEAHVWDYPDYPVRWVFSQHNLRGPNAMRTLTQIEDTMAALRLNGLQQNDFKYSVLGSQPSWYFDSVAHLKRISSERKIEIIPGVAPIGYSEGLLSHDPNLAEGLPAVATYVVAGDTGRLIPNPSVALPNGGFESVGANGKFTGWSFYDEGAVTVDRSIVHGGAASARCSNFVAGNAAGNCRFNRAVDCRPYSYYRLSGWLRTESLSCDEVRLLAIGQQNGGARSLVLTSTNLGVPTTTNGWRRVEVLFNTLEFDRVLLYAGIWGGRAGTIWWDDITIEDAGLVNVLRRDGTPLRVTDVRTGAVRREGVDVAPIVDSAMLKSTGSYPYHASPTLRRLAGGSVANGDTLRVSFFHAITTISDERGYGQNMICPSEEKTYDLIEDQLRRVDALYAPKRWFLGHDEIRVMNRDSACLRRGLTPAGLLADNVRRSVGLLDTVRPGSKAFVWSDMFDSLHNAGVKDYYLVNGDLGGVWNMIPRSLTIVNWNSDNAAASLDRFSRLGFDQITSPYYDTRSTQSIRAWRLAQRDNERVRGMMYTTWSGDYDFLGPFAYYVWSAGPYIIHRPVDSAEVADCTTPVTMTATVLDDPFDPADSIVSVIAHVVYVASMPFKDTIRLQRTGIDEFSTVTHEFCGRGRYKLVAVNAQGIERHTPEYLFGDESSGVALPEESRATIGLTLTPNPAASETTIGFSLPVAGAWDLRIVEMLGRTVLSRSGDEAVPVERVIVVDGLAAGAYRCELRTPAGNVSETLVIVR